MAEDAVRSVGDLVVTLLGVGGGTAGAVLLLTYIVKGSIVTAVKEAGKQELARLKAELVSSESVDVAAKLGCQRSPENVGI